MSMGQPQHPSNVDPSRQASVTSPSNAPAKASVLVIDDDDVSRALQCGVLRAAGHTTLDLPTAIGATRLIQEHQIDAVVLDICMPALSGDRLARLLRENPRFTALGVVLITGDANVDLHVLARKVAADAVVYKGEVRERISMAVEAAVKARRRDSRVHR